MDEGNDLTPPSGMYREFLDECRPTTPPVQIRRHCYWARIRTASNLRPSQILQQMIDEVNAGAYGKGRIDLILEDHIVRVLTSGDTVTGAVTAKSTLSSKVLIDATEYGDILPLTPARFRSAAPSATTTESRVRRTSPTRWSSGSIPTACRLSCR